MWVILRSSKYLTYTQRLVTTFFVLAAMMIALPFIARVGGSNANFWACFASMIVIGVFSGVNNVSIFSYAAEMPFDYMAGLFFGQGLGAIGSNLIRLYTITRWPANQAPENLFKSSLVFYSISAVILLACGIAQFIFADRIKAIEKASYQANDENFQRADAINQDDLMESFVEAEPEKQSIG